MRIIIYCLIFNCLLFSQALGQSIDSISGRWAEFEFFTDSCLLPTEIVEMEIDDWDIEFSPNGNYVLNQYRICFKDKYTPSGKWKYTNDKILELKENHNPCFTSDYHQMVEITWFNNDIFYYCNDEEGRHFIVVYIRQYEG